MMEFGAVFQTNPPASRVVQLAQLAEVHGFSHVWTFDSHVLWQEPYVIHSAILAATRRVTALRSGADEQSGQCTAAQIFRLEA